ncbi:MAG: hypothetical protein Q7J98_04715 [Kiritimatiellia bacterium]|nr:hypothetical protein [Kiritimatiellia bacterium]
METTLKTDFQVALPEPTDDDLVVALRLYRYNRGVPCGASALRQCMQKEVGHYRPVPSVRTIHRILMRQGLTHNRTGWYAGDDLNATEQRLMQEANSYRNFADAQWSADPRSP